MDSPHSRKMLRNVEKRGVQAARNGPSQPPTPAGGPVAKAEMSMASRRGSREVSNRAGWCELLTPWIDERVRSLSYAERFSLQRKPNRHRMIFWFWTKNRYQRNAAVQPLSAQLGLTLAC